VTLPRAWLRDWALFGQLLKRDVAGRYRGSWGGLVWAFVQPLFLLCVYTLAFGLIVGVRRQQGGDAFDYGVFLFIGLIIYNAFSECIVRAPTLILTQPNFVKKVVFPLYILPVVCACTALLHAAIGFVVWLLVYSVLFGVPKLGALALPLILLSCLPSLLGIGWLLAGFGAYFRDLPQIATLASHALLFLTPVFYEASSIPSQFRAVLHANPLSVVIDAARGLLLPGEVLAPASLIVYAVISVAFAITSLLVFNWMRPRFADVV
jgi:lipopolysaccharide transport system permease protein